MRKQLLTIILGLACTALAVTGALAEEWVYVTKNGKKFHHANSSIVKRFDTEKMTREQAVELGYEPSQHYDKDAAQSSEDTAAKK
jgi:hypothetical protein